MEKISLKSLTIRTNKEKQKETLNTFRIIDDCVKERKNGICFGLKSLMKRSNGLMSRTQKISCHIKVTRKYIFFQAVRKY